MTRAYSMSRDERLVVVACCSSAGACIHTHHVSCVMATLLCEGKTELRITHQEMIKVRACVWDCDWQCNARWSQPLFPFVWLVQGIIGHGYLDELVIPIIENTPVERDLTDSLRKAILKYGCFACGPPTYPLVPLVS